MNVYDPYPDSVEVDGRVYRIRTDYDSFLRAVDVQDEKGLTALDKVEVQCRILVRGKIPADYGTQADIIRAVFGLLPKGSGKHEKYMDLHQDARMIRSAFRRIGIDLTKDKIHFLQFFELLADLPSDTALMRAIDIRRRPLPKPTKYNTEEIQALQEAKARVALTMTDEERMERFAESLKNTTIRG